MPPANSQRSRYSVAFFAWIARDATGRCGVKRNRGAGDDGGGAFILNKLNAGTRAEAVALGIKRGLILL